MTLSAPRDWALADNNMRDEGTRALAQALRHNSTIKWLDLESEPYSTQPSSNDAALLLPWLPQPLRAAWRWSG